ncbi:MULTISPECIES: hypothetical protein [unclassified Rhizobium]|uniref:hypothetical protein n=1 Tax=unclassified Rhizobium TaxID=2613769 RepID=UPI000EAAAF72|nr:MULTISPECIES: hypothetical protein [unclassified Rhizobium]AYG68454.1 hypothetical protein CCGE531_20125 [Rhizobium sp. CCGE531]AYG74837.1 hypothetical protein CCGE532_19610 [Rhizobium sp. CCGE532]
MTSIPNTPSAALAILQRLNATGTAAPQRTQSRTDSLIAVSTGQADKIAASKQPTQGQSKVSEAFFATNGKVDLTKMKLDLIYRTGKALGVEHDDYASMEDFAKAMQKAYSELEPAEVNAIEHDLGLDKLGLSLEEVINSAKGPERNDKVTRALKQQMDKSKGEDDDGQTSQQVILGPDEVGLYSPSSIK